MTSSLHKGAGLIEVAIALLVISMASLGLARTLLSTWASSVETVQRVEAIQGLEGMLEVMRSNWAALPEYQLADGGYPGPPLVDCNQAGCSSQEWGRWNLWWWQQRLQRGGEDSSPLAALGSLVVPRLCIKSTPRRVITVITWGGRDQVAAAPNCTGPLSSSGRLSLSMLAPGVSL